MEDAHAELSEWGGASVRDTIAVYALRAFALNSAGASSELRIQTRPALNRYVALISEVEAFSSMLRRRHEAVTAAGVSSATRAQLIAELVLAADELVYAALHGTEPADRHSSMRAAARALVQATALRH